MPAQGEYGDWPGTGQPDGLVVKAPAVGFAGGKNIILDKFDRSWSEIDFQKSLLTGDAVSPDGLANTGYIDQILDLIKELELPEGWLDVIGNVVIAPVTPLPPMDQRPGLGTIDLNLNWPEGFPARPFFTDPPTPDLSFTAPTKPDDINPTIDHVDDAFNSEVFSALTTAILSDINNNGRAWGAETEQAIYDRAISRNRLSNESEYQKGLAHISSIGSAMPEGAASSLIYRMQELLGEQESDINNDILVNQAKLAWDASMSAQDRAVQVEQILRAFYESTQNRSLEVQKAAGDLTVRVYAAQIDAYIKEWEGVRIKLEAEVQKLDVVLKRNAVYLELYKADWEAYKAQVDAVARENEAKASVLESESRAYVAETGAYEAWYNALTSYQKMQIDSATLELDKAKAELEFTLQELFSRTGIQVDSLKALTEFATQAIASALNAVGASIGHSTSSSDRLSESFNHGDNFSENHNFDDTET
jgi:hypothetical protein